MRFDKKSSGDPHQIWVGEIEEVSAERFCEDLAEAAYRPSKPVLIFINSPGGCVDALASMLSAMDSAPNDIITVATGSAMSAGAILLSHGNDRFISPHARVMIHEISSVTMGKISEMRNDAKENDRLNKYFITLLAKNCGKTFEELEHKLAKDFYLSAEDALAFGIVDAIGIPSVHPRSKYDIRVSAAPAEVTKEVSLAPIPSDIG